MKKIIAKKLSTLRLNNMNTLCILLLATLILFYSCSKTDNQVETPLDKIANQKITFDNNVRNLDYSFLDLGYYTKSKQNVSVVLSELERQHTNFLGDWGKYEPQYLNLFTDEFQTQYASLNKQKIEIVLNAVLNKSNEMYRIEDGVLTPASKVYLDKYLLTLQSESFENKMNTIATSSKILDTVVFRVTQEINAITSDFIDNIKSDNLLLPEDVFTLLASLNIAKMNALSVVSTSLKTIGINDSSLKLLSNARWRWAKILRVAAVVTAIIVVAVAVTVTAVVVAPAIVAGAVVTAAAVTTAAQAGALAGMGFAHFYLQNQGAYD